MRVSNPREHVAIQAGVTVFKNFTAEILQDEEFHLCPCRIIVAIDPITQRRELTLYTDDGHGNGDGILKIELE